MWRILALIVHNEGFVDEIFFLSFRDAWMLGYGIVCRFPATVCVLFGEETKLF